jgi:4-amino-4-deoxy-L-arabinose transferase-like glycosyltransferase
VQRDLQIMNFTQVAIKTEANVYSKKNWHSHSFPIWFYPYLGTTYACPKKPVRNLFIFVFGDHITQCSFTSTSLFLPCYQAGIMGKTKLNKNFWQFLC